jgi:DNA topoisomerase IA
MAQTSNSAHDDIRLKTDKKSIDEIKKECESASDSEALLAVVDVLDKLEQASKIEAASVKRQRLTFTNQASQTITFDLEQREGRDWRTVLSNKNNLAVPTLPATLSEEECSNLMSGNYLLKVFYKDKPPMLLFDLLNQMDTYAIGRPSTFASSVQKLFDHGWAVLDADSGHIKPTKEGAALAHLYCSKDLPAADPYYCLNFSNKLADIANGRLSHKDFLTDVYRAHTSTSSSKTLHNMIWQDVEELYQLNPQLSALEGVIDKSCNKEVLK